VAAAAARVAVMRGHVHLVPTLLSWLPSCKRERRLLLQHWVKYGHPDCADMVMHKVGPSATSSDWNPDV
jgi:hypothetical protein